MLEGLESFGGTWLMHKYPGIRSDSDLYTFGYRFKPWIGAPIATAEEILTYMGEVIEENDLARHIRYRHAIQSASWSSEDNLWTVEGVRGDSGEAFRITANFLWMCQGYYRHAEGYTPEWKGMEDFKGRDRPSADLAGRSRLQGQERPRHRLGRHGGDAGAGDRRRLQACDPAAALADLFHPGPQRERAWPTSCARSTSRKSGSTRSRGGRSSPIRPSSRAAPSRSRSGEGGTAWPACAPIWAPTTTSTRISRRNTGPGASASPSCPTATSSRASRPARPAIVTDEIERFTEKGILLQSGKELEADIIVTATGFNLSVLGDIAFAIDGKPLDFSKTVTYRGMMFTGVPNMVWIFGYFRASWTLRVDLLGDFVCRLLNHMKKKGAKRVEVTLRPEDKDMELLPWIDPENFNPGYLMRSMHLLPKRGDKPEWQHTQDYWREKDELPAIDLDGKEFVYR